MAGDISNVISGGYCIGCAACTRGKAGSGFSVRMDSYGRYQASKSLDAPDGTAAASRVCPFSKEVDNEDRLAAALYPGTDVKPSKNLGRYLDGYVGSVAAGGFREAGSSGGFTSWILAELLDHGLIDAVIHAKPTNEGSIQFKYGVSRSKAELLQGAKSHYYPVEMSGVLEHIRTHDMRYAVVGVPCFIKAIRLLCKEEEVFQERVKFCIGLFCGHLKSTGFAEFLAAQTGILPHHLTHIDFRTKIAGLPSSQYGITATGEIEGETVVKTMMADDLKGRDWGMGFFKYEACDFCDDISAETADVGVGDAWLPEYVSDSRGTNVVVVRNQVINKLVRAGIESKRLDIRELSEDQIEKSQSANVRHRREDLAYRLHLKDKAGLWRPVKRTLPDSLKKDPFRIKVQKQRMYLRDAVPVAWREAKQTGDYDKFFHKVDQWTISYKRLYEKKKTLKDRLRPYVRKMKAMFKNFRS